MAAGQRKRLRMILTARGDWQDKVKRPESPRDDYRGKPFQTDELIARLKRHRAPQRKGGSLLSESEVTLELDENRQCLKIDRRPGTTV